MTQLAYFVTLGWVLFGIVMFAKLDKRRALLLVVILGWLFLPVMRTTSVTPGEPLAFALPGLKFTKPNTIGYAVLAGGLLFDRRRWLAMRPTLLDLPMAIWCLCPLASSLDNDLGLYDGLSTALDHVSEWGVVYWAGRIYLRTTDDIRALCHTMLAATVVYLPFCWIEMRISPQLHNMLYGYHAHEFLQSIRFGGFRPMVFLPHSLILGMWMWMATILAYWVWTCGSLTRIRGIPLIGSVSAQMAFVLVIATSVLCRAMGAMALGLVGIATLFLSRSTQSAALLGLLLLASPLYMAVRATGMWTGEDAVAWIADNVSEERAQSLGFRLDNENQLAAKATERPLFGWGGWGRARVYNDLGRDVSVTDGAWIIILGECGLVGLISWSIAMLWPSALLWKRISPRHWSDPEIAPLVALATILVLNTINNLLNVDTDPVYLMATGGLTSVLQHLALSPGVDAAEQGEYHAPLNIGAESAEQVSEVVG